MTVVRERLETFLEGRRGEDGEGCPRFQEESFRRYLRCGVLGYGFARVRCERCGAEDLVGFSCKSRVCPSCLGRRMSETAAYLRDELLPEVPYRQWVLTVPWELRARLSVDRQLLRDVLTSFLRPLFSWQRRRARLMGLGEGETGAVTFLQGFGGALGPPSSLPQRAPGRGLRTGAGPGGAGVRALASAERGGGGGADGADRAADHEAGAGASGGGAGGRDASGGDGAAAGVVAASGDAGYELPRPGGRGTKAQFDLRRLLDRTDVGEERRRSVLGGFFAPGSDFREGLLRSLFRQLAPR